MEETQNLFQYSIKGLQMDCNGIFNLGPERYDAITFDNSEMSEEPFSLNVDNVAIDILLESSMHENSQLSSPKLLKVHTHLEQTMMFNFP